MMRRWLVAALWAGIAQGAQAADLPDVFDAPALRGGFSDGLSRTTPNWQGAYVGAQLGYTSANMDFSRAHTSLVNFALQNLAFQDEVANLTLLGQASPVAPSFGGFVGWNSQWDDVVLGIEANYSHFFGLKGSSENELLIPIHIDAGCLVPPPGAVDSCAQQLSGNASATITDVVTLRGRAGWAIDQFLPYIFGGAAFGHAHIARNVTVTETDSFFDATTHAFLGRITTSKTQSDGGGVFAYGYTAGIGLEAMFAYNMFARAEYEYVKFTSVKDIDMHTNTVRLGVGYKF